MKKITFYFFVLIALQLNAQEPVWNWVGTASGDKQNIVTSMAVDKQGNSYSVGFFYSSTLSIGSNNTLTNTSPNNCDLFLVKTDRNGNIVWTRSAGGIASETTNSVAVDDAGNVYWTGSFASPQITFGNITLNNAGPFTSDIFVAKYNIDGNVMWVKNYGGAGNDNSMSIKISKAGNFYIAGNFTSSPLTFGSFDLINSGAEDIFITKFDLNGNPLWAKNGNGSGADFVSDLAVDKIGNSYVVGRFTSANLKIGAPSIDSDPTLTSTFFITKFDNNGNTMWAKSASNENGQYIALDSIGNAYVTGSIQGDGCKFGPYSFVNKDKWTYDQYLVKYSSVGNLIWAQQAGGDKNDIVNSIVVDKQNNAIVAGTFQSTSLAFGQTVLTSNGDYDIYLARYSPEGIPNAAIKYGGTKTDEVGAFAIDNNGDMFLAGMFNSPVLNFGTNSAKAVTDNNMFITSTIHANNTGIQGCMDAKAKNYNPLATTPAPCVYDTTGGNQTKLTYKVTVPQGTNECYIAGDFNTWSLQKMNKIDPTHYVIDFQYATPQHQYKYFSGPNFKYTEMTSDNQVMLNRNYSTNDVVVRWAEVYDPNGTTMPIYGCKDPKAKNYNPLATMPAQCIYDSINTLPIYGCMNPLAKNYNPLANISNGSCIFSDSATVIWGCMNPSAKNYNSLATKDDGKCMFGDSLKIIFGCTNPKALNFNKFATKDDGSCQFPSTTIPVLGCTNPVARNYNPLATVENGTCTFGDSTMIVWGCMNANAANYNPKAVKDNGTCIFGTTNIIYGCMNTTAKNYNSKANKEDGTCIFVDSALIVWGCTNPVAKNYNPKANKENGSCVFVDSVQVVWGCTNVQAMNYNPKATRENGSCTFPSTANMVYGCTKVGALNYNPAANKENGSCIFKDSVIYVLGCTNPMAKNYNPKATKDNGTCIFQDSTKMILGCTNPTAKNFNRLATQDNGTCTFSDEATKIFGCTKSTAKNFNPLATVENGSCVFADTIKLPIYGCTNKIALNYNPLATVNNGTCKFEEQVVKGCMDKKAKNYNALARVNDGSCVYDSIKTVYGCMDPVALNYNPLAKIDNNNCVYQTMIPGCMDPMALNFNPYANAKDGSCKYPVKIWGCTDKTATNYNATATHNDGNCQYTITVFGCTDPLATNFNPLATKDNRTCVFPPVASLGCTNKQALNYNPNANTDNGTCVFETITDTIKGCMDKAALNYNPVATKSSGNCQYAGVSISGCTSQMALNYNKAATIDDESCIFAKPVNIVLPIDKDKLVEVKDTLVKIVENSCAFNFSIPIDTVYIVSSTVVGINQIEIVWAIKQGLNITNVTSTYAVDKDGKALLYLSLVCNGGGSKVIASGKYGAPYGGAGGEGVTVSSYYQVPSNVTRLLEITKNKAVLNLYPNPVKDLLQIEYKSSNFESITIQLTSIDGKRMLSKELNAIVGQNHFIINTSELNEGIYMVSIQTASKLIHVNKLVKN
ncbi:MAG: T9SS type A sorting domain-containing protein [Paludibacter sp.]